MKKRFIEIDDGLDFSIKHIESGEEFYDCESVVEILNELAEENTMLKERRHEDINELSVIAMRFKALEKENQQLQQFKSKFYDMIDKRIRVLEHDYNQAVKNGMQSNSVSSEIELLEELKEEMDHT